MKDFKLTIIIIFSEVKQNIFNEQKLQRWKPSIKNRKKKKPNENSGTQKYDFCNEKMINIQKNGT